MTKKLKSIMDKYNSLRTQYFYAVTGDDPIRTEYLENEINRLELLIAGQQAAGMLTSKIKQLDKILEVGND